MKQILILFLCAFLGACSSMIPYKDQDLNYLHGIEQNPQNYMDKVVSFGGEVQGVTEDTNLLRLVLKIDVPLYYYAIGKDTLSYELLLVTYEKKDLPQMTGIKKGHLVKVLARVANYETRKNLVGKEVAVLHLKAFALSNRDKNKDFFHPQSPEKELYQSWKSGRLFFEEQPEDLTRPADEPAAPAPKPAKEKTIRLLPLREKEEELKPISEPIPGGIIFDEEEEPFILPPDPQPEQPATPEGAEALQTEQEQETEELSAVESTATTALTQEEKQEVSSPKQTEQPSLNAPTEQVTQPAEETQEAPQETIPADKTQTEPAA
ncbi:MAG: hypothetical protein E7027_00605 [Elusimicrobium sp.]|uniref:Lipoprotein n=1 Tax=Candidatus Avelusimicrobium gallicola TaxID=2562704 RepID=A0A928HI33_9BACT|nr:hypothetical protein [Elusimicrobium sp.]